jgi:asparagine synthase (glutamine-hydrolysing)
MCWRHDGDQLRYAERADALGGQEIDPQAIFDYLFFHVIPSPRTIYREVQRVPAGHCLLAHSGKATVAPYRPQTLVPRFAAVTEDLVAV